MKDRNAIRSAHRTNAIRSALALSLLFHVDVVVSTHSVCCMYSAREHVYRAEHFAFACSRFLVTMHRIMCTDQLWL